MARNERGVCLAGSFGGWFIVARVVGRVSGCVGLRVCLSVVIVEGRRFGRSAVPVVRVPSAPIVEKVGFPKAIVISTALTNSCLHPCAGKRPCLNYPGYSVLLSLFSSLLRCRACSVYGRNSSQTHTAKDSNNPFFVQPGQTNHWTGLRSGRTRT